jgi:DNA-binding transcriptional ArsR family regulator
MHSFQVMADPVRRRIVEILASGEHASGEITAAIAHDFGITRTAVARHLAILLNEDWVTVRADYTNRFYRLQPDALGSLQVHVQWLEYLWERRIGTIERHDPEPHHAEPFAPRSIRRKGDRTA